MHVRHANVCLSTDLMGPCFINFRSISLTEVDIDAPGLQRVLEGPRALEELHIKLIDYDSDDWDWHDDRNDTRPYVAALAQQRHPLCHLTIHSLNASKYGAVGLDCMAALKTLEVDHHVLFPCVTGEPLEHETFKNIPPNLVELTLDYRIYGEKDPGLSMQELLLALPRCAHQNLHQLTLVNLAGDKQLADQRKFMISRTCSDRAASRWIPVNPRISYIKADPDYPQYFVPLGMEFCHDEWSSDPQYSSLDCWSFAAAEYRY